MLLNKGTLGPLYDLSIKHHVMAILKATRVPLVLKQKVHRGKGKEAAL